MEDTNTVQVELARESVNLVGVDAAGKIKVVMIDAAVFKPGLSPEQAWLYFLEPAYLCLRQMGEASDGPHA
jgi:hypothetical protein